MARRKKQTFFLFLVTFLAIFALPVLATVDNTRAWLALSDTQITIGQEFSIDVMVDNQTAIYGADMRLTFDPNLLEVVDTDPKTAGVQVTPGDYFDVNQAFLLQHQVNNEVGTIDFALTLLNPAPPVDGNGRLVHVTFSAKQQGQTVVQIAEILLGTPKGDTVAPTTTHLDIQIVAQDEVAVVETSLDPNETAVLPTITTHRPQSKQIMVDAVSLVPLVLGLSLAVGAGFLVLRKLLLLRRQR